MYKVVYQIVKHQSLRVETKQRVTTPRNYRLYTAQCLTPNVPLLATIPFRPTVTPLAALHQTLPRALDAVSPKNERVQDTYKFLLSIPPSILKKSAEMSSDLTWLLVRNWNSFQVKGGHGPVFSREKVSKEVWVGQCRAWGGFDGRSLEEIIRGGMTEEERDNGLRAWGRRPPGRVEDEEADNALDISDQVIV